MKKFFLLLVGGLLAFSVYAKDCTVEVSIEGPIGPGSVDVLVRSQALASQEKCSSLLLLINTPGGSLESTRLMVSEILSSPRPVLCLVYPDGGHAGSAGAVLLQACHVNGAMEGTNIGAATPILGTGESAQDDLRKKMINDLTSWMDSLTGLRERNPQFGREIVTEAKAVAAKKAQEIGAIDFLVHSKKEFLEKAAGKEVKMGEKEMRTVQVGDLLPFELDLRFKFLSLLSDPQLAYLLFLGSLALLYFEFTHPGTLIAGVTGGLGLILSLVALHKLNVEWGGLMLILLGVGMLIAEMFVPSFGALGLGGMAAFIFGSVFLFDPAKTGGYTLPLSTIILTSLLFGSLFLGIGYLVLNTLRLKRRQGVDELLDLEGEVRRVDADGKSGALEAQGEIWNFESEDVLSMGDRVIIQSHEKLKLKVQKKN
ncbi:MAG TPA: hypothetical protein DCL41_01185 [Bdellovibrionales bacterium]|nr:hypothetical protein [Pseudobdellovibrionaceae bacterium]HAG90452.1 hypothetical protein [Bdellovibrionales bacterium]|tara:strand:+ start:3346 stop:4623 length:1278 start_codon:yes stop_codon:yes gene_type:complete